MTTIKDPMFDPQGSLQGSERAKTDFLDLETGENVIRMFPASEKSVNGLSTFNFKTAWQIVKLVIEGNQIKEKKMKPVFDGVVHGGLSKDLVAEYNNFFKNTWLNEHTQNETERLRIMDMSMRKSKEVKVSQGLPFYKTQSAFYGKGIKQGGTIRGLYQITFATAKKVAELFALIMSKGQGITYNPLTDPQNGIPVVITMNPSAQPADYYKAALWERSLNGNFMQKEYVIDPMTQEDFDYINSQRTLDERYINSFTRRDFENQVEGLKNWEKLFALETGVQVKIMDDTRFQEIGNAIKAELDSKVESGVLKDGFREDTAKPNNAPAQNTQGNPVQNQALPPVQNSGGYVQNTPTNYVQPEAQSNQGATINSQYTQPEQQLQIQGTAINPSSTQGQPYWGGNQQPQQVQANTVQQPQQMFGQQQPQSNEPKPIQSGEDLTARFNKLKEQFGN